MNIIDFSNFRHLKGEWFRAFEDFSEEYPIIINARNQSELRELPVMALFSLPSPCIASDYFCGYVGVSKEHPLYGKDYSEINEDFDVCGGLTFSRSGKELLGTEADFSNYWFFGFDCNHAYNDEHPYSLEMTKADCRNLADKLKELSESEAKGE